MCQGRTKTLWAKLMENSREQRFNALVDLVKWTIEIVEKNLKLMFFPFGLINHSHSTKAKKGII